MQVPRVVCGKNVTVTMGCVRKVAARGKSDGDPEAGLDEEGLSPAQLRVSLYPP